MKCKACNGTGKIMATIYKNDEIGFVDKTYDCCCCNGTGKIKITNEEWFDGLSTEEKAKVIANATYSTAETPLTILWGGKEAEQKKWELWLKQPHTTEVKK